MVGVVGPISDYVAELFQRLRLVGEGDVARYIPELAKADPSDFAIVVATTDGGVYCAGDFDKTFTIQSISKPFVFGHALDTHGREYVLSKVGVEPSGEAFNAIVFDEATNRPLNPMVNSGAIAAAALVPGTTVMERQARMLGVLERFAGRPLTIDEAVFNSEKETGHRNRAIAYMMLNSGMISGSPEEILDVYFAQCSVLVSCSDLALMAATLANGGIQPRTGERLLTAAHVRDVLTVMTTCGMYNYAGEWSYEIGMPAKSGVAGGIIAVVPGQLGIAIYSPLLDRFGNSVRGILACREISRDFHLHAFQVQPSLGAVIRRELSGLEVRCKRIRPACERAALDERAGQICVLELQGALFFGSAERVIRRVTELSDKVSFLVLDFHRVSSADDAAIRLLAELAEWAEGSSVRLVVARLPAHAGLSALSQAFGSAPPPDGRVFPDVDTALEWCETALIGPHLSEAGHALALAALDLFKGLSPAQIKVLERAATAMSYKTGDVIIREGDSARLFFVIARGSVSVRLRGVSAEGRLTTRVASIGQGMPFGEMALFGGGKRSADIVAEEPVICYGFSVDELRDLGRDDPDLLATILANITFDLSERLRRANEQIRALEF